MEEISNTKTLSNIQTKNLLSLQIPSVGVNRFAVFAVSLDGLLVGSIKKGQRISIPI
jgi:hypothetical protein